MTVSIYPTHVRHLSLVINDIEKKGHTVVSTRLGNKPNTYSVYLLRWNDLLLTMEDCFLLAHVNESDYFAGTVEKISYTPMDQETYFQDEPKAKRAS